MYNSSCVGWIGQVVIKGRLSLEVLEKFCEELRSSRSRTCTAALVRCAQVPRCFNTGNKLYYVVLCHKMPHSMPLASSLSCRLR